MKILLLAGTYEARVIAGKIESKSRYSLVASLAGVTKDPLKFAKNMRFGGFGGRKGLEKFIIENSIKIVIDATHPFATKISSNAQIVCERLNISRILFVRPPWIQTSEDNWIKLQHERDLIPHLSDDEVIFIASGRQSASHFKLEQKVSLICRQIDEPITPFPYGNGRYLVSRPPFSVESEMQLFEDLNIDWLLVKNSGGSQSKAKLIAARKLGIRVGVISRPNGLKGHIVEDVNGVIKWLDGL